MKKLRFTLSTVLIALSGSLIPSLPVLSAPPPTQVGKCADTFIKEVGTRLVDGTTGTPIEGSGTGASLTNGVYLVSYDEIAALKQSKVGEKVKLCLLSIPSNCPPGDDRGRFYSLFNYRTRQTVKLPDSQHMCGGA
ncbi:MAG: hypothetical protein KME27_19240 [Lyngbya sp. HA4199-MV5]|jgi:hypothetical protein|nr:hypothetical protein [Lyngbya sp. HA4199-MV5]